MRRDTANFVASELWLSIQKMAYRLSLISMLSIRKECVRAAGLNGESHHPTGDIGFDGRERETHMIVELFEFKWTDVIRDWTRWLSFYHSRKN